MARYAGLLLAPAEGFGLRPRIFFKTKIIQKKTMKKNKPKQIHKYIIETLKSKKCQKWSKSPKISKNLKKSRKSPKKKKKKILS